ncbi:MAG: SIMPL domain-containing protein [Pseudomonadota bacterium]
MNRSWFVGGMLMLSAAISWAAEAESYNRVSFSAEAQVEVQQDLLVAVLSAQREGRRADRLASEVNQIIQQAVAQVKQHSGIKVRTLSYQTYPIHDKKRKSRWRVSQRLRLESQDSQLLGAVLGKLQAELQLQSLDYRVSPAMQQQNQSALTQAALENFQQRAFEITRALGMKRYKLVRVNVNGGGQGLVPRPLRRERMMLASADAAAPVTLEAGTQRLSVTVNGEIELFSN